MYADHITTIKRIKEMDKMYLLLKIVTWDQYLTITYDHYFNYGPNSI
jgi:hypothetical protein